MAANVPQASIIIPTRNDSQALGIFLPELISTLTLHPEALPIEILITNDGVDSALAALESQLSLPTGMMLRVLNNETPPFGFGLSIRRGFETAGSEAVVLMMADGSDRPEDLLIYLEHLRRGAPAVFGSRFTQGGRLENYPTFKWILNRIFNWALATLLRLPTTDVTNAFKAYTKRALNTITPLTSTHFEITAELPIKILRAYPDLPIVPVVYRGSKGRASSISLRKNLKPYLRAALTAAWARKT
jgi:dolichol-phosphate mannosyltransferase